MGRSHTSPGGRTVFKEILAAPADYYVNVHSQTFLACAVRGQLA
jgi:hypothetical protein